jgi:hypothetical protein
MAVFDYEERGDGGLTLVENVEGFTVGDIAKAAGCNLNINL